jgi:hypothetical protein
METLKVSQEILKRIKMLEIGRQSLTQRSTARAKAMSAYEYELGTTILKLKNNAISDYGGLSCTDLPITIIEKIAKAMCFEAKLEMEKCDTEYKLAVVGLNCLEAELNGFQSVNRHLGEV